MRACVEKPLMELVTSLAAALSWTGLSARCEPSAQWFMEIGWGVIVLKQVLNERD
jgi:hypothetical protein